MKKLLLPVLLLTIACQLSAQPWLDSITKAEVSLSSASANFAAYWQGRTPEKGVGIKPFKRWEWFWQSRLQPAQPLPKRSVVWEEWNRYKNSAASRTAQIQNASWTFSGPATTQSGYHGLGRLNCIAFHPTDPNIFYVGTAAGGLWKTTNAGGSWTPLTDNLPVMGVSDIAIDPSNPATMYLVTGDCDGSDTYSIGVMKSTDAGITWSTTGMTWVVTNYKLIKRIQINPANPQMLWLVATDGIWRTTNGGTNWTMVQSGSFVDLELNPADPTIIYAASYAGNSVIYRSANAGASFSQVQIITGGRRVNLAVTPHNTQVVQALVCNSGGGLHSLWRSNDAGLSFTQYLTGGTNNNMLNSSATGTGSTTGQGTYDLAFNINPEDADNIWLGGVNTWSSNDGGVTWGIKTIWSGGVAGGGGVPVVHADKHFQAFHPITKVLYECNDGGLYWTANRGITWTDISAGLGISQIYRIGVSVATANQVMIGLQDNSTKEFKNNTWFERLSTGDGFESAYDPTNSSVMYTESYYGSISRTLNGGSSWSNIAQASVTGTGVNVQGAWLTPYILNPLDNNTLLVGKREVYRSTDRGTTWTTLSSFGTAANASALAYAPSDTATIYAAFGTRLNKTTDGGATWTLATTASSNISYIAVHPTNPLRLWITHASFTGNKVMASVDGGTTWTPLNGSLPALPVNCITYQTGSNDGLYIGTDVGVYYRDNSMADWVPFQTGLPNVIVNELEISYGQNKIWAGTYGRGLWSSPLYTASPCTAPAAPTGGTTQTACAGASVTFTATVAAGNTVDWFSTVTGGSAILSGSNTFSTSVAGTYYAAARNTTTGCISDSRTAFTLSTTALPATPAITPSGSTILCALQTLVLQASVATGVQWYKGGVAITGATAQNYTVTESGSYTVVATSGGCASSPSAAVGVTVNPAPPPPTIGVNGAQFTSSAATGNQWFLNGAAIPGATGQVYDATTNGSYTVSVTVNGCTSAPSAPYSQVTTSINSPALVAQLVVAPNPVRNKLELMYTGTPTTFAVELVDINGRVVRTGIRFTDRYTMDMQPLPAGNYVLRIVKVRTGERLQQVIVKQ